MANLIQATVVNIGGNPQPIPLSQAFLTSGIIMQEATIASSQVAGTQITYYSGPFSNTIFYATETVAALVAAANTGTTSQVQVTVYEINGDSLPVPVSFGFPASGVVLKESVHGSVNTILTCAGVSYGVSETEASIVTAANVDSGGGGGGWAVTGTTTLTGGTTIDANTQNLTFSGTSGSGNFNFDDATTSLSSSYSSAGVQLLGGVDSPGDVYFNIQGTSSDGSLLIQSNQSGGTNGFTLNASGIEIGLFGTSALTYAADYSANYTSRSLIDKGYADGHYMVSTANFAWNSGTNKLTIQSGALDTGLLIQATSSSNYSPKLTFNTTTFNLAASIWADYNGDMLLKAEFGQYIKFGSAAASYNVSINAYNAASNAAPNNYTILALAPDAAAVPLMLRGATSQTGNLQEWQSVAPAVLASVNSKGRFTFIVPTTAASSFNLPAGAAPSSPVDGDVWREDNTNTGLKVRINNVTKTLTVS